MLLFRFRFQFWLVLFLFRWFWPFCICCSFGFRCYFRLSSKTETPFFLRFSSIKSPIHHLQIVYKMVLRITNTYNVALFLHVVHCRCVWVSYIFFPLLQVVRLGIQGPIVENDDFCMRCLIFLYFSIYFLFYSAFEDI